MKKSKLLVALSVTIMTNLTACNSGSGAAGGTSSIQPIPSSPKSSIGIIQYNVKSNHGGWGGTPKKNATPKLNILQNQMDLIYKQVIKKNPGFIVLEEATDKSSSVTPLVSDELKKLDSNLEFETITSRSSFDVTQIAYNKKEWLLIKYLANDSKIKGPAFSKGRSYNMALFSSKTNPKEKILVIAAHFPHLNTRTPLSSWDLTQFIANAKQTANEGDLSKVKFVLAGDLNEIGEKGANSAEFKNIFNSFGTNNQMNPGLPTCCYDNNFTNQFDRVVTNIPGGVFGENAIISNGMYPLISNSLTAEHKAIYVEING